MKKFIIPVLSFAFFVGSLCAQDKKVEFSLRGGFSYNMPKTANDTLFSTAGVHVGPLITFNLNEALGIQTGVLYNYTAAHNILINLREATGNWIQNRAETQSIDVPVRLQYTLTLTDEVLIHLMAGPNFNYGLSYTVQKEDYANNQMSAGYPKLIKDYYASSLNNSRFDAQFGIGLGIQYLHYSLTAGYDWGLLDRDPTSGKFKTNSIKIGLAYTF